MTGFVEQQLIVFSLLKNHNFWKAAKEYDELLFPIANTIHHVERDSACVTQLLRLWRKMKEHFIAWQRKYRLLDEFSIDEVLLDLRMPLKMKSCCLRWKAAARKVGTQYLVLQ
jgi:hypothetical protein